jgi:dolichyl-phosphate beta-glucosyltransferase
MERWLDGRGTPYEVLVVDDGSADRTKALAGEFAGKHPAFRVVALPENRGKGAAVRAGFAESRGSLVLFSDADLSTPLEELDRLSAALGDGADVAIASRALPGSNLEIRQAWYREHMGKTFNALVRLFTGLPFHDTQCGFKLFPGDLARSLAPYQRLDGFAFDVELLVLARWWGYTIREVGVRWRHVDASRVSPIRHSSQMMWDLLRLWWWRSAGRLPVRPGHET